MNLFKQSQPSRRPYLHVLAMIWILMTCTAGFGQSKKAKTTFHYNGGVSLSDNLYVRSNPASLCAFSSPNPQIRKATLNAILDWKGDYKISPAATYTVALTIKAYSTFSGTGGLVTTLTPTLTVTTNTAQAYVSIDFTGYYTNINRFAITSIMGLASGSHLTDIENVIAADVYFTEDFDYDVSGTSMITLNNVAVTNGLANFTWSTNCRPAPNYQLQLLRLYNTAPTNTTTETTITTDIDWSKALSVETGNSLNQLSLTMAEGTGYYAWRVRPIGNAYEGGIANDLNWGAWSDFGTLAQGTSTTITAGTAPYLFFYTQFDNTRNWIFTRNFVEGDATTAGQVNIGEAINYANGLQMAQQQQVRLTSQQKTLVNQTVYDYCGRAALNTLPAPIDRNTLGYIPSYIKNTSGQSYQAADFDALSTYTAPAVMDSSVVSGGLNSPSQYYSSLNTNETDIPTAAGYPYTRTLFSKDGLNKPLEKSSPGYVHRINTSNKHTARTLYSGVADAELVSVFGDEAPYENSVYKTINIDANNQSSVTYISKEGKTIATCLSTPTVSNLDPIPSSTVSALTVTANVNNNNSAYGSSGYRSFKSFALTELTNISLSYSLTPNTVTDACHNFCITCDYKVTLKVTDNNDPDATPKYQYTTTVGSASATAGCTGTAIAQSPTFTLDAGAYTVERIVEASTTSSLSASGDTYVNDYSQKLQSALQSTLATGTGTLVSDAGVPLLNGSGLTYTISMSTLNGYLTGTDLNGLYTYLGVISSDTHKNIKVGCDVIKMPVWFCNTRTCTDNDMGFERYLYNWYRAKNPAVAGSITNQQILDLVINSSSARTYSYSVNEFDTVVNNMVNCGGYSCQKLWDCWQSTVASYGAASLNNTSYTSPVTGSTYSYGNDYLDMFLSCAGYNIQGITSTSWTGQTYTATATPPCGTAFGYKSHPYAWFNYATPCDACEQLYCKGTTTVLTTNCPGCGSTPWAAFTATFNANTSAVYSQTATNNAGTVTSYTSTTKNDFYNCYRHTVNCTQGSTPPAGSYTNAIATITANCSSYCDSRYDDFVTSVTDAYHYAGQQVQGDPYVLVSDPVFGGYSFGTVTFTGTPTVSLSTVYCQANQLLATCKNNCSITQQADGSLGSSTQIQNIANVYSGHYKVALKSGEACPLGYSAASSYTATNADFYLRVLNNALKNVQDTTGTSGIYWNYYAFLTSVDAGAVSLCDDLKVFVHPAIPSYFAMSPDCGKIVYIFNSNASSNSITTPKALYSTTSGSLTSSATFSYSSTGTLTAQSAATLTPNGYIFGSGFSPVVSGTAPTPSFALVQDAANGAAPVSLTAGTTVVSYSNSAYPFTAVWTQSVCANSNLCRNTYTCSPICYTVLPTAAVSATDVVTYTVITCEAQTLKDINNSVNNQVAALIGKAADSLQSAYKLQCIKNLVDNYTMQYSMHYHHYTLYYYDRAGNLTKTVPPKGVESYTFTPSRSVHPAYSFITEYEYNSLGQLVRQKTPDGGETTFQYDVKGKLRFSQNAKQLAATKNSYTKYDALARIVEVGELSGTPTSTNLNDLSYPAAGVGADITQTFYSTPASGITYFGNKPQRYLQNRVSYSLTDKDGNVATTTDQVKTCYSYDPHGNVEWITQDIPELGRSYIGYEYDLVSGSVVKVKYNEAFADRFYHRYTYDIDKRIKTVETSKDNFFWEKDAAYSYYLHGPLKRALIGHDQIQGLDYTYTIHGWLKSINNIAVASTSLTTDPGGDGDITGDNMYVAKDAYGMMLGYYAGDYVNKTSYLNAASSNPVHLQGTGLYNGNISSWMQSYDDNITASISGLAYSTIPMGRTFKYDQLNRITAAQTATLAGSWTNVSDYLENFAYDPNGNITKLLRNGNTGTSLNMDSLTYRYSATDNRLNSVHDLTANTSAYTTDIDNQAANNYTYDAIGNLTADASGSTSITAIAWNVYGKIGSITKSDGGTVSYLYDASGNRVYKKVTTAAGTPTTETTTYYVKDASGNSMAVYDRTNTGTSPNYTANYTLREEAIYGSDRLGTRTDAIARSTAYTTSPTPVTNPSVVHANAYSMLMLPFLNNTASQLFMENINTAAASISISGAKNVTNMSALTTNTAITFVTARAQATAFDDVGNPLLTVMSYSSSASATVAPSVLMYVRDTMAVTLPSAMTGSINVKAQAGFIKKPGSDDYYYLFTIGTDGKAYYHTVDASAGILVDYNNLLDGSTTYGNTMALLDDRVGQGASVAYLKRYDNDSTYIQPFAITATSITALPKTTVSASDPAFAAIGDIQLSAGDSLLAIGTFVSGAGRVQVYKVSADHQTLSSRGKMTFNTSTYCKSLEFGATDKYLFFTVDNGGSVVNMKRAAVSSFSTALAAITVSASTQAMDNRSTASIVSAIRRGTNNALYYVTNTGGTDVDLRMFAASEDASIATATVNTSSNIRYLSQGAFPVRAHLLAYALPTSTVVMSGRTLNKKEYELKDHLGNVHMTVADYKVPYAGTSDTRYDERFNDGLTTYAAAQYTTTAGSPTVTAVTNPDTRMMVTGTSGSAVNKVITLTTGHKYLIGFDYQAGTCAAASYSLVNLNIGGALIADGRTEVTADIGAGTSINLQFTCNDPASSSAFYIDNILIKDLGTTMAASTNTVLNEDFSGSSYPWIANQASIAYGGTMNVSNLFTIGTAGTSRTMDLLPGQIYRVRFDLSASSIGTATMSFNFAGSASAAAGYYDYTQPISALGTYTFYVVPTTTQNNFYINVYKPTGHYGFSFDIDNFIVEECLNGPKPLYTAVANDLTDYYAFGAPMPGRQYHVSAPNKYAYGFNGKRNDADIASTGDGAQDYGMRIYNPSLGKFLSVDPLTSKFAFYTPYQFAGNKPIAAIDLDGAEEFVVIRFYDNDRLSHLTVLRVPESKRLHPSGALYIEINNTPEAINNLKEFLPNAAGDVPHVGVNWSKLINKSTRSFGLGNYESGGLRRFEQRIRERQNLPTETGHTSIDIGVISDEKVYFNNDDANVLDNVNGHNNKASINKMVNFVGSTGIPAHIEGNTDSNASTEYNQGLSERRANNVLTRITNIIQSKGGVLGDFSTSTSTGNSENNPAASNNTEAGRAENRRVDIKLDLPSKGE